MNAKGMTGIGVPRLVGGAQAPTRAQGSAPRPAPASARGPHRAGPGAVWLSEVLSAWSWTRAQIRLWRQRARGRPKDDTVDDDDADGAGWTWPDQQR